MQRPKWFKSVTSNKGSRQSVCDSANWLLLICGCNNGDLSIGLFVQEMTLLQKFVSKRAIGDMLMPVSSQRVAATAVSVCTTKEGLFLSRDDCSKQSGYYRCIPVIWPRATPLPTPTQPPPSHTFTWETFFPRGIKLTGPVWFRKVGCQCSLQAHGEPWIMDLPPVWLPSWDSQLPPPLTPVVTGIVNVPLTANDS